MHYKDLTGVTFGRWTVTSEAGTIERTQYKERTWNCTCRCGTTRVVGSRLLLGGGSQSCGCVRKDYKTRLTHGLKDHRLYPVWKTMRQRCSNPRSEKYKNYGARGIHVCPEWNSFSQFLADMESTWKEGDTIERIDVDGNYCPQNCTWIPASQQGRNRTNTVQIVFDGKVYSVLELAEALGLTDGCVRYRLKHGWSIDQIVKTGRWEKNKWNNINL